MRVRISPGAWIFVSSERCLSSGTGLCDGLITRPEKFSVFDYDREDSTMKRSWPTRGSRAVKKYRKLVEQY